MPLFGNCWWIGILWVCGTDNIATCWRKASAHTELLLALVGDLEDKWISYVEEKNIIELCDSCVVAAAAEVIMHGSWLK